MSRKDVTEYVGGKGPRQSMWEAVRRLHAVDPKAPFTYDDVRAAILPRQQRNLITAASVRDYLYSLQRAGYLAFVTEPKPREAAATMLLVKDAGFEAPRVRRDGTPVTQGLAQEQMWRTLRLCPGDISAGELVAYASTETVPVDIEAAKRYMFALERAGYLDVVVKGKGNGKGGVASRWRLKRSRNTGPRPPMICRTKVIYDPNEDRVVYTPPVTDEDAIYGQ